LLGTKGYVVVVVVVVVVVNVALVLTKVLNCIGQNRLRGFMLQVDSLMLMSLWL
jgi:hypothetical protein